MIKIRISYEREQELLRIQEALSPIAMKWRIAPQRGKYRRAYAETREKKDELQTKRRSW
jgi:hypothetical protein